MIVRKLSPCIYFFLRGGPFPAYEHYRLYLSTLPELKTGHIGRSEQQYVSTLIWCILSLLRKRNRVYIHHPRFHTLKMKVDDFLRVFVLKPFLQSSKRKNQEMNCIFTYLPSIHISSLPPKKGRTKKWTIVPPPMWFFNSYLAETGTGVPNLSLQVSVKGHGQSRGDGPLETQVFSVIGFDRLGV